MSLETMAEMYDLAYIVRCEGIHAAVGIVSGLLFTFCCLWAYSGAWGCYRTLTTFGQDWRERFILILCLLVGSSLALTSHWLADTMQWGW